MLIKNYDYNKHLTSECGKLNIIEDVSEVIVHMGSFTGVANGPRFDGPLMPTTWVEQSESAADDNFRFVDYTDKNGIRSRLKVTAYAYICNDKGETIEKVVSERD